jgi:lipopolysaccharide/colanic/teichoic acid biosynthesis glycosyltransferase
MFNPSIDANAVNAVSQLIQLSVAPVFLLAAVGGILNVFTGRLSRIIDKVEKLDAENRETDDKLAEHQKERRDSLAKRMRNMNLAILFCTITGLLVATVIVIMFSSALFNAFFKRDLFDYSLCQKHKVVLDLKTLVRDFDKISLLKI